MIGRTVVGSSGGAALVCPLVTATFEFAFCAAFALTGRDLLAGSLLLLGLLEAWLRVAATIMPVCKARVKS
jgi:hypothetical protein